MHDQQRLATVVGIAFILTLALTPAIRDLARKRSMLDVPNSRSAHSVPIPRLGGLAIFLGTLAGVMMQFWQLDRTFVLLACGAILITAIGLLDDLRSLGAGVKLAVQVIAAAIGAVAVQPTILFDLPGLRWELGSFLSIVTSVFFIVVFVNAFNFIDGLDGFSTGIAVVICLTILGFGVGASEPMVIALVGALVGFLVWNINPASMFMGDSGSLLIGYVIALGALDTGQGLVSIVPLLIIMSPILFDVVLTIAVRAWHGKSVTEAHSEHLYQQLMHKGFSPRSIASWYYALTVIGAIVAIRYQQAEDLEKAMCLLLMVLVLSSFALMVSRYRGMDRRVANS